MDRALALAVCARCRYPVEMMLGLPIDTDGLVLLRLQMGCLRSHTRRSPDCRGAGAVVPEVRAATLANVREARAFLVEMEG